MISHSNHLFNYPDPILRATDKKIASFDDNLKNLVHQMLDVMYKRMNNTCWLAFPDGFGLSAPQVGVNVQLMVFNPAGEHGEGKEIVLNNPRVQRYSKNILLFDEGCLSFSGIYADVQRLESVKVDAQDVTSARFTLSLSGRTARVFQDEFDHLQVSLSFACCICSTSFP